MSTSLSRKLPRGTRRRHLSVSPPVPRRIVRIDDARLAFVGLREGVAALFPHPLDLADFPDGFLELLHPAKSRVSHAGESG